MKMPFSQLIFYVLIVVVLFLFGALLLNRLPGLARPTDDLSPREKEEAETLRQFRAQSKKDELVLLTGNSFFPPSMRPLAGQPVFLAAAVEQWNGIVDDEQGESGDMVEFEVVQGRGRLAFFTNFQPGQTSPVTQTKIQTPALGGSEAFAWLLTEPDDTGEAVVRARFVPQGERAIFMDRDSQVLFHIRPIQFPAGRSMPSAKVLAKKAFQADRAPHAEVLERDLLGYPGGQGVFSSDIKAIWFGPGQAKIFHIDPSGQAREAAKDEEKRQWVESRQQWHNASSDMKRVLTHLDAAGQNSGTLSYAEDKTPPSGRDGFRPAQWVFERYRASMPEAGPEDQVDLTTYEEDPEKPVEVGIHRVHRSGPIKGPSGSVWGRAFAWTGEIANIHHIYSTVLEERPFFQSGIVPVHPVVDELKRVVSAQGSGNESPREVPWPAAGCTLRDLDVPLEKNFRQFGHPPGMFVDSVKADSPAAHAGLQAGDVVVLIDWQKTSNAAETEKVLAGPEPEEGWPLLHWRGGVYLQDRIPVP